MEDAKRQALTRRANKLIEWMKRDEYAVYVNDESVTQLIKLIDLIIWALERSVPEKEWGRFKRRFRKARALVTEIYETDEEEIVGFNAAVPGVIATLQAYLLHINK